MDSEQLRLFLRQAFALSAREAAILQSSDNALLRAMANIRSLIGNLPDDGILREQQWRQLRPLVELELAPLNDAFAQSVYGNLAEEAPEMAAEAAAMVRAAGVPLPPVTGLSVAPSVEAIMRTQVDGRRLAGLFEQSETGRRLTPFIRSASDAINRRVIEGITRGLPTNEIADMLAVTYVRNAQEYINLGGPTAAREIRAGMRAIARTAIQDANRQVHEEVYRANADLLSDLSWEWVAVLDSRTCPTCAPLDGKRKGKRSELPRWPVHPNCRCQVVAVDPDEAADVRSGQAVSTEPLTWKGKTWDQMNEAEKVEASKAGIYATKTKVKGESLHRKAVDVKPGKDGKPPTYADYLVQVGPRSGTAASDTQRMFFGGGTAGNERAVAFNKAVQAGTSPEKALRDLINTDKGVGRFKPVKGL